MLCVFFEWFPGVWILYAEVSEHSVCSILIGTRTYLPMKMEQTECSETSAYKFQTPGNHPKESIQHSVHGESLKSRLLHLYGEEVARHIRLFEKLRIKKTKLLTSLTVLLRCRDHNTIPRFLQFQHHIHSWAANRIYQRTSFAFGKGYIITGENLTTHLENC